MTRQKDPAGRVQLFLISLAFFGPLILATWLYFSGGGFRPEGRTNHGQLLEPIVSLADALPDSAIHAHNEGHWLLAYVNDGVCEEACNYALLTLRQSRLMLGKDMDRLVRVFLHGETAPDTVFIASEHVGLITLTDNRLSGLLENKRPAELAAGGFFLVDPLGNLVMYFRPDIDPGDMVEDIEHLLELSRIG
jgi:cytochrome oxidase Cu insertion factor (SCO1/SenC/PrrC family)